MMGIFRVTNPLHGSTIILNVIPGKGQGENQEGKQLVVVLPLSK